MQEEEIARLAEKVIQIAEKLNKKPDEFINKFEEHFENVPYNEKGYSILLWLHGNML